VSARLRSAALAVLLGALASDAGAQSIWETAKEPRLRRASELLAVAERARVPAEDILVDPLLLLSIGNSDELNRQLNARTATLIKIARGGDLPDPRLRYLLGDALVKADKEYLAEGRDALARALEEAPDSPLAADAWFWLAIAEGKLRNHEAERTSYTRALALQWDPELRATILMNRAESSMTGRDLVAAMRDYRMARAQSRSAITQSLATWGLAVATERDGDLPTALELGRSAASIQFGPSHHRVAALDLPDVFFTPPYEQHYYRALATMGSAVAERDSSKARALLQTAELLWTMYIGPAERDNEPWVENAKRHRVWCQTRNAQLDTQTPGATKTKSKR
jgi:tetratricopeptide (TPR) repeat protein